MLQENYEIQPFEMKNIPLMLEVVVPMWSPPAEDMNFRRFYVEGIIRRNYFENDFHYQLIERTPDGNSQFTSMAFFARKSDICKAEDWFAVESQKFAPELLRSSQMGKEYIELMDIITRAFMKDDDIQLTLYISRKKGCGSKLLNELCDRLRAQGWKKLYLWTDCECDWEWYTNHGYELVSKDVYGPFSEEDGKDYLTYIFRKAL